MGNIFTLDSLKEEAERSFAPFTMEVNGEQIKLQNLMRLGKADREKVMKVLRSIEEQEDKDAYGGMEELPAALNEVFSTVAADGKGKKLIDALDGDLALGMTLLQKWAEGTQVGEAGNSPATSTE